MELRQDRLLSLSRRSTSHIEEITEEFSISPLSALATHHDADEASRLSARLLGYGASQGIGAVAEASQIMYGHLSTR
jgi:hypothetical protein